MTSLDHSKLMQRCVQLAQLGDRNVRPNPMVGALLTYNGKIIAEGFHQKYGEHHAEVNVLNKVNDYKSLNNCILYVSLEPCNHYGKTPPCTELIINKGIKNVVIGCLDPSDKVSGKGVEKLKSAGISVTVLGLKECIDLIREFRVNHLEKRPYTLLKWVQSQDQFIGKRHDSVWLSSKTVGIYTHKWRAYTDAIMVGANTIITDNPALTTRNFPGNNPQPIILDGKKQTLQSKSIFSNRIKPWIYEYSEKDKENQTLSSQFLKKVLNDLFNKGINHLTIEGGPKTQNAFIRNGLWDEAIVVQTPKKLNEGIRAPGVKGRLLKKISLNHETIQHILRK